ncbi:poly-beta-hydroxybutyrate-responsive repressor [Alkalicoccobacillus murimartini]|uniref:Poly-beta-hydroxybutyrate-responsive repressor n=1 Tax=Alkalicoccobacillus murimartini TaxID=171685 RepID=A0ABT9YD49_9BACI|nr:poly-beta-hydroxybutyrate-responsive repressor [Alkalicoccobacillus murimartini]MDQ0205780.1 poly-beta-hydroxybutyrate-responsive repressor [Alkalicoccobacillus murimartini]
MADQKRNEDKVKNSAPKNLMIPMLLMSLREWDLHGYKLIEQLSKYGFTSIDQGNVYRTLRQLEKDNMVQSQWDTSTGGPAKRIYSLTDAGEDYLKVWADSLQQYQSIVDHFFSMYSNMMTNPFLDRSSNKEDNDQ